MRASFFPNQHAGLRSPATALHSATVARGTQPFFSAIVCSLPPPRDVVIDFGKYKGCKLGTLPSRYLQWLIRESHQPSLSAWGDYAQQVLQDPYYRDRLEWQRIEKLVARGDLRKGGPPASGAGAKSSMAALGWDLSDSKAWFKVNFSLLGTTEGGRIPRRDQSSTAIKPAAPQPMSGLAKPVTSASIMKSSMSRLSRCKIDESLLINKSLSSGKASIEARVSTVPASRFSNANFDGSSSMKAANISSVKGSSASAMNANGGPAQKPRLLTLQEEVQRRRQLRKERSARKSSITLPSAAGKVENLFPGRESLLKRARQRKEIVL